MSLWNNEVKEDECKSYPVVHRCDDLPKFEQTYSDIVRDDDFKRIQSEIEAGDLNQDMGNTKNAYDYADGVIPADDPVTSLIVQLRSGKFDKADVQKIQEQLKQIADDETNKYNAEQKAFAERALAEQRQSYLDKQTGFASDKLD